MPYRYFVHLSLTNQIFAKLSAGSTVNSDSRVREACLSGTRQSNQCAGIRPPIDFLGLTVLTGVGVLDSLYGN